MHFPSLHTPAMFVHGTRDGFGSIDEMSAALKLIPARTELLQIAGAGHVLMTKRNRDEAPKRVVEAFRPFAYDKGFRDEGGCCHRSPYFARTACPV
jgi:hypothetical protein